MAARKKAANDTYEVVSDSIHEASEVMKAMSSETRLKILCALSEGGECPFFDISKNERTIHATGLIFRCIDQLRKRAGFQIERADDKVILGSTREERHVFIHKCVEAKRLRTIEFSFDEAFVSDKRSEADNVAR